MAVDILKQTTDVRADLQSHPYDLSERHLFTLKAGQLVPVANWQCVPGDYFEIDPVAFMRTQKLNTAAFARMRLHLDFFFVPYWQLWHEFPQMKYQRQDPTSSTQYLRHGKMSPYMSLRALYSQVLHSDNNSAGIQNITGLDQFGYNAAAGSARLCDMLGYGSLRQVFTPVVNPGAQDTVTIGAAVPSIYTQHVNLWPWLAYQKIWSDFYRNDIYDIDVNPLNFNVDDVSATNLESADIYKSRTTNTDDSESYDPVFRGMFTLRYRQWKKDYFTGLFPDKQFGDVSMLVGSSPLHLSKVTPANTSGSRSLYADVVSGTSDLPVYVASVSENNAVSISSGISALDIRRAELMQIWKEKTLRAGNKTNSQQVAHFGVSSEYIPDDHVRHLGGASQLLDINEVVSQSNNNTGSNLSSGLGELGGKGTSLLNGNKIRFHVKDDGLIMCIASVLPESSYNSDGLQHSHTRIDPFDYFTPAFQNLGFEAVTRSELDIIQSIDSAGYRPTDIIGYAPPYYDLKQGIDRVHGEFASSVIEREGDTDWLNINNVRGSLSYFDSARRDAANRVGTLSFFYVDPHVLDSVFSVNANSFENTDQFWIASYFHITAVRPISVLGLPNF